MDGADQQRQSPTQVPGSINLQPNATQNFITQPSRLRITQNG